MDNLKIRKTFDALIGFSNLNSETKKKVDNVFAVGLENLIEYYTAGVDSVGSDEMKETCTTEGKVDAFISYDQTVRLLERMMLKFNPGLSLLSKHFSYFGLPKPSKSAEGGLVGWMIKNEVIDNFLQGIREIKKKNYGTTHYWSDRE